MGTLKKLAELINGGGMATIALVTTVYNRQQYLAATLESGLAQTDSDFEWLIWDDGSTDDSLAIAQDYAKRDARIRVIAAEHQGLAGALKSAIVATTAPFLGWVDSDDLLAPTALAETVAVLKEQPEVGMVYTHYEVIDAQGRSQGVGKRCQIPYSPMRLLVDFMTFHFRLIRRSVYDQVGGIDAAFPWAEDYDLCLRLSEVTTIQVVPQVLYAHRRHASNVTNHQLETIQWTQLAIMQALKRRGLEQQFDLELRVVSQFSLHPKRQLAETPQPGLATVASRAKRGVVYCALQAPIYLEAALISAWLLRQVEPDLPIVLLSDFKELAAATARLKLTVQLIDPVALGCPEQGWQSRWVKTQLPHLSPFDETLYLDADILPLQPIAPIWSVLDQAVMAMAIDTKATLADCSHVEAPEKAYTLQHCSPDSLQFNGGVVLWRRCAETTALFETWQQEWQRFQKQDQLALVRAIQRQGTSIHPLPKAYNFPIAHLTPEVYKTEAIRLLHCWGGLVHTGRFRALAEQLFPAAVREVQALLSEVFTSITRTN
jgi:hypothetical protein